MSVHGYTDEQLRTILHAGTLPAHLANNLTIEDRIRLLSIIANDPSFVLAEREIAAKAIEQLKAQLRGRVIAAGAKVCRHCGAISTGGAYCPSGCGRV